MPPTHVFRSHEERREYEMSFETAEDQHKWEEKFGIPVGPYEYHDAEGAGPSKSPKTRKKSDKGKQRVPVYDGGYDSDPSSVSSEPTDSSISDAPNPRMTGVPPPYSIHIPAQRAKSAHDMPVKGSRDAPKTFTDVQNIIRTLEGYEFRRWGRLKPELLRFFDAERVFQKYKPSDVEKYVAKKQSQPCLNLAQWRGYFLKFNTIAGGPLSKGNLSREDYNAYFLLGIPLALQQILENRILLVNRSRGDEDQYTVAEINEAAEWYFRRNKYETMMVRAADLGATRDEEYSGEESDNESSDEVDDSDLEAFRRKRQQAKKKKKQEKKKKPSSRSSGDREIQRYSGNEEEVAKLISKLGKMNLEDPEYAPIYYKNQQPYHLDEASTEESAHEWEEVTTSEEEEGPGKQYFRGVYLTSPRIAHATPRFVQPVERAETGVRKARRQVFDGVYPPQREKIKLNREVRDLQSSRPSKETEARTVDIDALPQPKVDDDPKEVVPEPPLQQPRKISEIRSSKDGGSHARPPTPNPAPTIPDIQPLNARRVRFTKDEDIEMLEPRSEERPPRKIGSKEAKSGAGDKENAPPRNSAQKSEELTPLKVTGRQSELTSTVDTQNIMKRILDTPVQMTMREIMVTSKELRTEFQDLIKVKNVRAVLLGDSKNHPLIAAVGWPRTDGILIKIDMKTGGSDVCAIIDTGSQLDVVSAQTAALKIQQAVDMSQVTSMKDANGGQGQLQGWIRDVEFTCGAAVTVTDLWVSQRAPFSLLLGRPWQRGNLVSIDEREEGTYLVFKDRETRQPRYELLAVPYDGPSLMPTVNVQQYQSFAYWDDEDSPIRHPVPSSEPYSAWYVGEKRRMIRAIPRPATLENIRSLMLNGTVRSKRAQVIKGWETHDRFGRSESTEATSVLVQAVSRISTVLGTVTRNDDVPDFVGRRERNKVLKDEWKNNSSSSKFSLDPLALSAFMSSVQSTIRPSNRRALLPHFQEIQYLSRSQFASPPLSAVALNASGPVATIVDAVTQQWQGLSNDQPLVANPTFVASPNAIYHGEVQLPSGQVLHRSTALNAFRVIRNGETGLPVTMSCHEFTFHLAAPDDPQQVWELEAPYPTDERLRHAMATMSPDVQEELSYPTRATKDAPPMMPLEQRVQLNKLSRDGAAPAEDVVAPPLTSVSPLVLGISIDTGMMRVAEDIGEIERPKTPSFGIEGRRAAQHELAQEIHCRAKEKLDAALFADRVTVSRVTGFSPYQLLHRTDPILPFDLAEATFMVNGFRVGLSTTELLTLRIRQLSKHPRDIKRASQTLRKARFRSKQQFERRFLKKLRRETAPNPMQSYRPDSEIFRRSQMIGYSSLSRSSDDLYETAQKNARQRIMNLHVPDDASVLPPPAVSTPNLVTDPSLGSPITAPSTFSLSTSEADEVAEEARQLQVHYVDPAIPTRTESPPAPFLTTLRQLQSNYPIEFHPEPTEFTYMSPPTTLTLEALKELRQREFVAWRKMDEDITSYLASVPRPFPFPPLPLFVWASKTENTFELHGKPHHKLQAGEEVECFGMWEGKWRLTSRVERRHEMKVISRDPPAEWVYVLCQNERMRRDAWLKIPAKHFFPSTLTIRLRKSLHTLGSLFARAAPTFPRKPQGRRQGMQPLPPLTRSIKRIVSDTALPAPYDL
ncbi:hypothetical protein K438DRAFT_1952666 [Mycena galopus ATCC 62051]|nr:hypothetical protein K438DRAFT_1952666 [Mycena galopus ATCC 62051]